MSARRIALVCMTPASDANEHGDMELPSYGVRRILAALMADPALADPQVALIDVERADADAYVRAIEEFEPDLVGMSVYVWSTPCLVEVARRLKAKRPDLPSAAALAGAVDDVNAAAAREGGRSGEFLWTFPPRRR